MIYLFDGPNHKTANRLSQAYNGLTLNDDTVNKLTTALYEIDIVGIDEQWDAVTERKVGTHGLEVYDPFKLSAVIREDGIIRAPAPGSLNESQRLGVLIDAAMALNEAFDPVNVFRVDTSEFNQGFLPLTFSIPTNDTDTYPTGLIAAEYFVRSLKRPVVRTSQFEGLTCRFSLILQAADPRCYFVTPQTASRANAGTIAVDNSKAGLSSWPILTFTFTGTGSGVIDISHDGYGGSTPLRIDLSSTVATDVIIVDMEHRTVKWNGPLYMSKYVSGPWLEQPPTDTTWTIANVSGTLAATVGVAWSRAIA